MQQALRRVFVALIGTVGLVSIIVVLVAVTQGRGLAWLGAAAPGIGILGFFSYLMFIGTPRTSSHLWWIHILGLTGMSIALFASPLAAAIAAVGAGLNVAYTEWYSRLDVGESSLVVGEPLPRFDLEDLGGLPVSSDTLRDGPRVFMFFRGNWCPLCMAQITEIAAEYEELERRGVGVALISPQPHDNTQSLADKFDVNFEFYVDPGSRAARTLGILHTNGAPAAVAIGYEADTVLPTVVITDGDGVILWTHQTDNYRIRPDPGVFLEVIDSHDATRTAAS